MAREPLLDFSGSESGDVSDDTVRIVVRKGPYRVRQSVPTLRVAAGRDLLSFASIGADEQILIGRDENAELRLSDPTVSKRHAKVIADANGAITVVDLESTNGTTINGKPVRRTILQLGDHLEVGGVSLRLDLLSPDELSHLEAVSSRLRAADRDPLTGLLTRRFLEDRLPGLADQCARSDIPFTCAFVDVDHLKKVNDTHGHMIGDEVLTAIARLLMLGVRDNDPCVRYGGEEIVLFLPGSTELGGAEVSDRVRRTITDHDWDRTTSGLRVTASFGVAERLPGEGLKEWLHRADEAAYAAKRAGRNRVVRASSL